MTYEETYRPEMQIFNQPEYKWTIYPFGKDGVTDLCIQLAQRPCLWNRIWMRLFFGWRFEAKEKKDEA